MYIKNKVFENYYRELFIFYFLLRDFVVEIENY